MPARRRSPDIDPRRIWNVLHADPIEPGLELPGERARWIDDLHGDSRSDGFSDFLDERTGKCRSKGGAGSGITGAGHHDSSRPPRFLSSSISALWIELRSPAVLSR